MAARLGSQWPPRGPLTTAYTVTHPSGLECYLSDRSFKCEVQPRGTVHWPPESGDTPNSSKIYSKCESYFLLGTLRLKYALTAHGMARTPREQWTIGLNLLLVLKGAFAIRTPAPKLGRCTLDRVGSELESKRRNRPRPPIE